jgi:acyl carrier protein
MNNETALKWIAEVFNEPVSGITPDTSREDIPEWDSLGVLTLMADLDEKFDILLTADEMGAMTRVADILDVLQKHQKLISST